jgi:hypothetical protein
MSSVINPQDPACFWKCVNSKYGVLMAIACGFIGHHYMGLQWRTGLLLRFLHFKSCSVCVLIPHMIILPITQLPIILHLDLILNITHRLDPLAIWGKGGMRIET